MRMSDGAQFKPLNIKWVDPFDVRMFNLLSLNFIGIHRVHTVLARYVVYRSINDRYTFQLMNKIPCARAVTIFVWSHKHSHTHPFVLGKLLFLFLIKIELDVHNNCFSFIWRKMAFCHAKLFCCFAAATATRWRFVFRVQPFGGGDWNLNAIQIDFKWFLVSSQKKNFAACVRHDEEKREEERHGAQVQASMLSIIRRVPMNVSSSSS